MENLNIKESLPFGAISQIAKNANVHYHTVRNVIAGKSRNIKVINAIGEYLENDQQAYNKGMERISKMIAN